ncbi:hypothetical protein [Papillibacter cinnamivorans]|uniref:DUF3899 domain-containing protein n=1 Tax=Papillibacter cinnamivorans DSM 12816 TaxID=1122930 RepID=A0A1W2CAQ6_9FIRM|nr:hypothetical protein [Papillibacter cinnamivorans]SMC81768.1 hypothetical protein SAMN02745168_2623 [Papillibacter cinnamivorans DSM 12816]
MSTNTRIILSIVCFFFSFVLAGVGLLMRKYDFSCMFHHPWKKVDGLYIRSGLRLKKVADDTPENRTKYSKRLGNYFILFSAFWLFIVIVGIWNV